MKPHDRIHRLVVLVDGVGAAVGAVVTTDYGTDLERTTPHQPGPFDTPGEVLDRLLATVDRQMTLW